MKGYCFKYLPATFGGDGFFVPLRFINGRLDPLGLKEIKSGRMRRSSSEVRKGRTEAAKGEGGRRKQ